MSAQGGRGGGADRNGAGGHTINASHIRKLVMAILGGIATFVTVINFSFTIKALLTGTVLLIWVVYTVYTANKNKKTGETEHVYSRTFRYSLLGAILVILLAGGIKYLEELLAPTNPVAKNIYYVIVLDASEVMKEPFDAYPSKWLAVRTAFQEFYEESHQDSNYGLVLIGGQNPQEGSGTNCSLPTVPLIPVVSENGKVLPQSRLTLPKLQEQVEGQQPQGGGSLKRAFHLAKNQLESLPAEASKVIVLITNASDTCAGKGKVDWATFAGEIELMNNRIAIRKELILLDVEATQEVTGFAEQVNTKDEEAGTYNTFVQVVQTYQQLEQSISYMVGRNKAALEALQTAATATAQSKTVSTGQPCCPPITFKPTMPRTVIVAASATSTPTLTFTPSSTFTSSPTFTPSSTFTSSPTFTCSPTFTPTTPPPIIIPIVPTKKTKYDDPTPPTPPPPPERCGALCEDGTTSSSTGPGTCSSHGGVKEWLYPPNCP